MDPGTIIVEVTAVVGGIAALIATINGIYDFRERRNRRELNRPLESQAPTPVPPLPAPAEAGPEATSPRPRSNLPTPPTRLIGREEELGTLQGLLLREDVRLISLIGPGGVGKTRLALELATRLRPHYADGAFFVSLAPVTEPDLVIPTLARVLDVREQGGAPLLELLENYLHEKQMLLLLDNFEHVVAAAPVIGQLLAAAASLDIVVTSREVLRLSGEQVFEVPGLALPDCAHLPSGADAVTALSQYTALQLFVERARAANPKFSLTGEDAPAVLDICCSLDGLPLAIELAGARTRLLTPGVVLERLTAAAGNGSLSLLTGGARDLPARQQTMRRTIEWSYDLLDEAERLLFQRLGVFAGGWTLEAAEAVCSMPADPDHSVLDGLESLLGKSLIRQSGPEDRGRFLMLRPIREYALERLEESGTAEVAWQAHAAWCTQLTEKAEPMLYRAEQLPWLDRFETEHDNLRTALRWALQSGHGELCLRLAAHLARFWQLRDFVSEGRGWLEAALRAGGPDSSPARANALLGLGELVSNQGDWHTAWAALDECISIARALGDDRLLAHGLANLSLFKVRGAAGDGEAWQGGADESLALARSSGDPWTLAYVLTVVDSRSLLLGDARQRHPSEEALAIFETTGDRWGIILALRHISLGAAARGEYAEALAAGERGLAATTALGDRVGQAYTLSALGDITRLQGNQEAAQAYYEEALALYRELGLKADIPASLHNLGCVALARGDVARAEALHTKSLKLHEEAGNRAGMIEALSGVAAVTRVSGDPAAAARLLGAAEAWRTAIGAPFWPAEKREFEGQVQALRGQLDESTLASAWADGQGMTLEEAVAEALAAPASTSEGRHRSERSMHQ